ncbi:MAG TPA: LptF/LptG family permease [Candidatus Omnitrophota bacterium]|nr:LptF/LptG family permease [Candidatus Omnitrophota bacterium]
MKILRRYILRELAIPFMISLALFMTIFIVGNLVKLADLLVNKGVSLFDILKLLLLLMPNLLGFVLPTSVLTAILLTFGSFAQHNEIIAIKTSGIHLWRVMSPVVVLGFFISIVALILNDQILPQASHSYRSLVKEILIKKPIAYLEAGRLVKEFSDFIILAQKIEGNQIEGITIYQPQKDKPTRTIVAERGEILSSPSDKTLLLKLYNGSSDEPNPDDPNVFYKLDFKTFELPPIRLGEETGPRQKKIKDMTLDEIMMRIEKNPRKTEEEIDTYNALRSEFHKKISFSFASLVFAVIGLPLAIITRRGEAIISFCLAMGIVSLYYVMFVWANTMGSHGVLPPGVVMWLPNVFVLGIGAALFKRVLAT